MYTNTQRENPDRDVVAFTDFGEVAKLLGSGVPTSRWALQNGLIQVGNQLGGRRSFDDALAVLPYGDGIVDFLVSETCRFVDRPAVGTRL